MPNHGYPARPMVPIPVAFSKEDSHPTEMMAHGGYYNHPINGTVPANAPLNYPSNSMLHYPRVPNPPRRMTVELRGAVPGPILGDRKNEYYSGDVEEVIKYPRMDSSSHPPRPVYSHHTLDPYSPKPRAADGTQMMFQNIIGYTEPVPPRPDAGSAGYPNPTANQCGNSGVATGLTDADRHKDTKVHGRAGEYKKLCGNCKNPACRHPDAYICLMVEIEAGGAERRKLYGEIQGILGEMHARKTFKATK